MLCEQFRAPGNPHHVSVSMALFEMSAHALRKFAIPQQAYRSNRAPSALMRVR